MARRSTAHPAEEQLSLFDLFDALGSAPAPPRETPQPPAAVPPSAKTPSPKTPFPGTPSPGTPSPGTPSPGTPSTRTPGPDIRHARLNGQPVAWELRRARRRTIGLLIDERGLRVNAPKWVPLAEIEQALQEKADWILRKLVEWREHAARSERLAPRWEDGAPIRLLGRALNLRVDPTYGGVGVSGAELRVGLPAGADAEQLKDRVQAWLQAEARRVFAERIPVFAQRLGRTPKRWTLSSARTRWGSCTADGTIRLNWRLVHFPLDVIDYVVAHELAHLREMNHGPRFWSTVGDLFPEFEQARARLRQLPVDGGADPH